MLVAVPSLVTAFTLAASMEHGARQQGGTGLFGWWKKLPYLDRDRWMFSYLFAGLLIFIPGGITGIVNASYNLDAVVHNTAWLPAHFHQTVAGPVFLAFIAGGLLLLSTLTGKEIAFKRLNVWIPYLWAFGILIFSSGLFYGGVAGDPRRTNMGLTYTNPDSPLYRADWHAAEMAGAIGGALMFAAMLFYFLVFFGTMMRAKSTEGALELPVSELYHDEDVRFVRTMRPWLVAAAVLLIVAYTVPLSQVIRDAAPGAPAYRPDNPVAVR
jgi:cytochrome c oxidase subunit 1